MAVLRGRRAQPARGEAMNRAALLLIALVACSPDASPTLDDCYASCMPLWRYKLSDCYDICDESVGLGPTSAPQEKDGGR